MGKNDEEAATLAFTLISRLQGMSLLTLVFKDRAILEAQSQALIWPTLYFVSLF
jgi:hypothetical protein